MLTLYIDDPRTSVDEVNNDGETPAQVATRNECINVLNCLFTKCNPCAMNKKNGKGLVHYMCDSLVQSVAPLTALWKMRRSVKKQESANGPHFINLPTTTKGDTPIHVAITTFRDQHSKELRKKFREILTVLLQFEDINIILTNNAKVTPLESFLFYNKHLEDPLFNFSSNHTHEILTILLSKIPQGHVSSVVAYCINYFSYNTCKLLLNKFDQTSEIVLPENIQTLLKECFKDKFDASGETALHIAVRLNSTKLELLSEANEEKTWLKLTPRQLSAKCKTRYFETPDPNYLEQNFNPLASFISPNASPHTLNTFTQIAESFSSIRSKIHKRREKFQNPSDRQQMCNSVESFLSIISNEIQGNAKIQFLAFKPVLSGSMLEHTEVYSPNELDYLCVFTHSDFQELHEYGRIFITVHPDSDTVDHRVTRTIDGIDQPCVCPYALSQIFYSVVQIILDSDNIKSEEVTDAFLLRRNKVSTLRIKFKQTNGELLTVHVDLMPAFEVKTLNTKPKIDFGLKPERYYVIAKEPRHDSKTTRIDFQKSFSHHEAAIFNNISTEIKEGLILAKSVRLAGVADVSDRDLEDVCLEEKVEIGDLVTSHMLKTCLFQVIKEKAMQSCNRLMWAICIYRELLKCLYIGELRLWADGKPLFQCTRMACLKKSEREKIFIKSSEDCLKKVRLDIETTTSCFSSCLSKRFSQNELKKDIYCDKLITVVNGCCKRRKLMQIIVENILTFLDHCVFFDAIFLERARDELEKSTSPPTSSLLHKVDRRNLVDVTEAAFSFPSKWLHLQQFLLIENAISKNASNSVRDDFLREMYFINGNMPSCELGFKLACSVRIGSVLRQDKRWNTMFDMQNANSTEMVVFVQGKIQTRMLEQCYKSLIQADQNVEISDREFAKRIYEVLIERLQERRHDDSTSIFGCGQGCTVRRKCCRDRVLCILIATTIKDWLECFCLLDYRMWKEHETVKSVLEQIFNFFHL